MRSIAGMLKNLAFGSKTSSGKNTKSKRVRRKSSNPSPQASGFRDALVAFLDPMHQSVPRGPPALFPGRPSQKVTVKSRKIISIPTGSAGNQMFLFSPCAANNGNSMVSLRGDPATWAVTWGAVPAATDIDSIATSTPYSGSTLSGNDYRWKCSSAAVSLEFTGASLNRSGRVYILNDEYSTVSQYNGVFGTGFGNVQDVWSNTVGSMNSRTIHVAEGGLNRVEANIFGPVEAYQEYAASNVSVGSAGDISFWPLAGVQPAVTQGNSITNGTQTGRIGPPVLLICVVNTGSTNMEINMEYTEHWEFCHDVTLATLHTPTHGRLDMAQAAHQIIHEAVVRHTHQPRSTLRSMIKTVTSSPLVKSMIKDLPMVASAIASI